MTIEGLMTRTVRIHRRVEGSYDDPDGPSETFVAGPEVRAYVQQEISLSREARESLDGRDTATSYWLIIMPVGTVVEAYDRIETEYGMIEVFGRPAAPIAPRLGEHHVEARGRMVEG